MRKMPQIRPVRKTEIMTATFTGYHHEDVLADGEMYETENLSSDAYPALGPRKQRGITSYDEEGQDSVPLNGIAGGNGLVIIRGTQVYYNEQPVSGITVSTDSNMLPKKIVCMGSYVCIWPDKVYFNRINTEDCGSMGYSWESYAENPLDTGAISVSICRLDGTDYDLTQIPASETAPVSPTKGDLWIDESGDSDVLRQYEGTASGWVEVPTVYVKLSATGIGAGLKEYDTIMIKGIDKPYISGTEPSNIDILKAQAKELNGSKIVYGAGQNYIITVGMFSSNLYVVPKHMDGITVERRVPDPDYLCESQNRIWGCCFGPDAMEERKWSGAADSVSLAMYTTDGWLYNMENIVFSRTTPTEYEEGTLWLKPGTHEFSTLYRYKSSTNEWVEQETWIGLSATGIGKRLHTGETVRISGANVYVPPGHMPDYFTDVMMLNGSHEIKAHSRDFIFIKGALLSRTSVNAGKSGTTLKVNRETEKSNRVNEIRACKLGDFRNWETFMGLSTDSYAASVGTDGNFTGAATQRGYPVFFKENCIHQVHGYTPDSYQISTIMCRGVQDGSWRSIAVANEAIYYKGISDVLVFDGNMPISIGEKLGQDRYSDARGGAANGKYYLSMKDRDNHYQQFTYDTRMGIWYHEGEMKALGYAAVQDELYWIDEENNTLISAGGSKGTAEGSLGWSAEFGISGIEYAGNKYGQTVRSEQRGNIYMSRFDIRMRMAEGSTAELFLQYDSDGRWIRQGTIRGKGLRSFILPVIPRRCDHLRMRMSGSGDFRIFSISRIMEVGSDGRAD